jgi:hypothetical protein
VETWKWPHFRKDHITLHTRKIFWDKRPLCRRTGTVIYSFCLISQLQPFSGLNPTGFLTIIYVSQIWDSSNLEGQVPVFMSPSNRVAQLYPRALGSLYVASYNSQGYSGGSRYVISWHVILNFTYPLTMYDIFSYDAFTFLSINELYVQRRERVYENDVWKSEWLVVWTQSIYVANFALHRKSAALIDWQKQVLHFLVTCLDWIGCSTVPQFDWISCGSLPGGWALNRFSLYWSSN